MRIQYSSKKHDIFIKFHVVGPVGKPIINNVKGMASGASTKSIFNDVLGTYSIKAGFGIKE